MWNKDKLPEWTAIVLTIVGLLWTTYENSEATKEDAQARWVATANEFRIDLVDTARRVDAARAEQDSERYWFEWGNMVSRIEEHLADAEALGSVPHRPHGWLVVKTLDTLHSNCLAASSPDKPPRCFFASRYRSSCLLKERKRLQQYEEEFDPVSAIAACMDGSR